MIASNKRERRRKRKNALSQRELKEEIAANLILLSTEPFMPKVLVSSPSKQHYSRERLFTNTVHLVQTSECIYIERERNNALTELSLTQNNSCCSFAYRS